MNKHLICFLLVAPCLLAAAPARSEAGWTSFATVAELNSSAQFRYFVTLKGAVNPSGCSNKTVFYQNHTTPGSEQMFRLLLEAVSTGKRVRVYVTGNCELNGYSEISSVSIVP